MNTRKVAAASAISTVLALVLGCSGSKEANPYGPTVVLTGCLQPGGAPDRFRLAVSGSPNGAVGTTGARQNEVGSSGSVAESNTSDLGAPTTRIYMLVAGKRADLAVLQGRLVQVSGHLENQSGRHTAGTAGSIDQQGSSDQQNPTLPGSDQQNARRESGANPTTGEGPQSSVLGQAVNRPVDVVQVDSVRAIGGNCGGTK